MFESEIKEKIFQKLEYDTYMLKEYLLIYFKLFFNFSDDLEIRKKFNEFIKNYYLYSLLEYQILFRIGNVDYNEKLEEICLDMLEELEKIYFKQFNYNEYVLSSYEDAISMNDINRAVIREREVDCLTKEVKEEFIKKLTLK
ncbi:MAG: hypothetical protein IJ501_03325 [Bacilli bacterium]|nr:hypothetical protein [Bacilli bacterium]